MQAKILKITKVESVDKEGNEISFFRYTVEGEDGNRFVVKTDSKEFEVGQSIEIK
jgi:hypothetical protein